MWAPPQQHLSCCPHVLHGGNLRAATAGPERGHVADAAVSSSRPLTLEKSKLCLFLLQKNINATSCFCSLMFILFPHLSLESSFLIFLEGFLSCASFLMLKILGLGSTEGNA